MDWLDTPTFDRIADQGILFRQTYIEALIDGDYYAGGVGKGWSPGVLPKDRKLCGEIYARGTHVECFEDFLGDVLEGKPFHFWFCSNDPHRGYKPQAHMAERLARIDVPSYREDTPEIRQDVADYAFEVERFDSETGQMIAMLEERGLLENRIVIMSSDHGMPFPRAKGDAYMAGNHVPLAIMWADQIAQSDRSIDSLVSFVDIAPTNLGLANVTAGETRMELLAGRSWAEIFDGNDIEQPIAERRQVIYGRERHDTKTPVCLAKARTSIPIRESSRGRKPSRSAKHGKWPIRRT